jgi:predicted acetyltransferase
VVPERRRSGIGREAARPLFTGLPGKWELTCHNLNPASQAFWWAAIAATPHGEWRTIAREDDLLHRFVVE